MTLGVLRGCPWKGCNSESGQYFSGGDLVLPEGSPVLFYEVPYKQGFIGFWKGRRRGDAREICG